MTKLLRFAALKARGIVESWPQLKRLQKHYGFPQGRMLSPNVRTWTEAEIDDWYETRPVEGPAPRGAAKAGKGRPRKSKRNVTTSAATSA
jgi:predicted DNA-binding transcriptional regulator AlpA